MAKKLGITKGNWSYKALYGYVIDDNGYVIAQAHGIINDDCWLADAKLIADAGTTANKCNKLPSVLLQECEKMRAVLESILKIENEAFGLKAFDVERLKLEVKQALK